jgi:diguanylate cyclase (GGDEF)-like protein/PAS domain S-box-containing protein
MPAARSAPHPAAADAVLSSTRLEALRRTALLDSAAEGAFDRFARLASRLLGAPVALVSLVDADRQFFKSSLGLPEPWASARETPLSHSFCQHVVAARAPLVVDDARAHPLVHDNLAVPDLGVVAYLGVPIAADGEAIGSLCAVDGRPRAWTAEDVALLTDLADALRTEVTLRAALADAHAARRTSEVLRSASPDAFLAVDVEGRCTHACDRAARYLGATAATLVGAPLFDRLPPADRDAAAALLARVRAEGAPVEAEFWVATPGVPAGPGGRRVAVRAVPDGDGGASAAMRDVTARHAAAAALRDSEQRLRAVTESAADAIVSADAENRIVFWNAAAERVFGYPAAHVIGRPLSIIVPPEHRAAHAAGIARLAAGGAPRLLGRTVEVEGVRADGARFPMELSLAQWEAGGRPYFTSVVRDVSARKAAEGALARSHALLAATLEATADAILVLDVDGRPTGYNQKLLALWDLPDELLAAADPGRLAAHVAAQLADPAAFLAAMRAFRAAPEAAFDDVLRLADGRVVERHSHPQRLPDGTIVGRVLSFRDVTERKRLEAQLAHQAFHDPLTGLANRALFRDRVEHALARVAAGRDRRAEHVAVLYLDLDDFKGVNDTLGHAAGDRLLQAVAERLLRATRGYDTVARLGGDEYAVLIEGMATPADADLVVRRVADALAAPVAVDGRLVRVRASAGLAHATGAEDAEALVRNADVAMYEAKTARKGGHAVFAPAMHSARVAKTTLEADLRAAADALAAGAPAGFALVYQPVVDLGTGRVRAFEALMRWTHPARGAVPPALFIPAAEEAGVVAALGRWALGEACGQLAAWLRAWDAGDAAGVQVNVNVSGRQLGDGRLAADVAAALAAAGLAPERLTIEVTETAVMADAERAIATLRALKEVGVTIAVDDFGTGYSSLAYLQRFPVDVLKLDKAFVDGVARGGPDAALARTVVALGRTLGLRTVAEGVETEAQRAALAALGCAAAQGYLFSRPLAPDAFAERPGRSRPPAADTA